MTTIHKVLEQVDKVMMALKSGDHSAVKTEYLKLSKLSKNILATTSPTAPATSEGAPAPVKRPPFDWEKFESGLKLERTDF